MSEAEKRFARRPRSFFAVRSGAQAAMLAPTEILAEQHYATLSMLFAPFGFVCGKLTGGMTAAAKRRVKEALADGTIQIVVGTHALLEEDVRFSQLGLVIADEQQRFGVRQRAALLERAPRAHMLVMSATPIPRTLALVLYGDLDISRVDELPPGRKPVETFLVDERYRARLNAFIEKQVADGGQVYVVCPAVEQPQDDAEAGAQMVGVFGGRFAGGGAGAFRCGTCEDACRTFSAVYGCLYARTAARSRKAGGYDALCRRRDSYFGFDYGD